MPTTETEHLLQVARQIEERALRESGHRGCRARCELRGPNSTADFWGGPLWYCGASGSSARLSCRAGRRDATGGPYCEAHGGRARAEREARLEWNYVAPASVGGDDEVLRAGCWTLTSHELCVVIRPAAPRGHRGHHRWTVALGTGSLMEHIPGTWDCAVLAERASLERWRHAHDAMLARIQAARGGTLQWGMSPRARSQPYVIAIEDWEPGERTTWGPPWGDLHRDPLPEALAAPLVPPRLGHHARRRTRLHKDLDLT
jgi:hypothetical protein